ncbi:RCC1/BLIP-II [Rhizodiscina lignyota]|uniref:RCC1/BLIP-II n=1 Tax=Rhizodiscina lignyota TaxID=1504668 RepID=A0A9P4M795_9PEZI|nr:RCC1/BLIP-II [Rhizodiscina lignyota]
MEDEPETKKTKAAPKSAPKAASKAASKAAPKTAPKATPKATTKAKAGPKRAAADDSDDEPAAKKAKPSPKAKTPAKAPPKPKAPPKAKPVPKSPKQKVAINEIPKLPLDVFVFGEGGSGELGLGVENKCIDVKRPRLNPHLSGKVVQVAAGGMHAAALTSDNRILTWGVNDQGALGRDSEWRDRTRGNTGDDNDDSDDPEALTDLNPYEAIPTAIPQDAFPEGTKFVKVVAGDSASFALTDDGQVYGWGTFRGNEGVFGFSREGKDINVVQHTPMHIAKLKNIIDICAGANHMLALDKKGLVYAWGAGQQNQLGRRIVERNAYTALEPSTIAVKKVKAIGSGSYHSFAIDENDKVWAWGLNNFGETGIPEGAGGDNAVIGRPTIAKNLSGKGMKLVVGGGHHSAGVTENGECFLWGRMDGGQIGIAQDALPMDDEDMIMKDEGGRPRILLQPMQVPNVNASHACCGPEHTLAVTKDGKAFAWGFNVNYQLGLGHDDDVNVATEIHNKAVDGKMLNWAGTGGQYSMLAAPTSAQ